MTFGDFERILHKALANHHAASEKKAIYQLVVEHFTGIPYSKQRILMAQHVPADMQGQFLQTAEKLSEGMPVQYALGEAWFMERTFLVSPAVLIPRPETEELVHWVVDTAKEDKFFNPEIIDIGTGSGCIAISIAKLLPAAKVTAIDISNDALLMAKENAKKLEAAIAFKHLNFLEPQAQASLGMFDYIVSNPPYIPALEMEKMESHVTEWEPAVALFTPNQNPQLFYEQIILFSKKHLKPAGIIFMEGHQDYLPDTEKLFRKSGYKTKLKKDIHGNLRMLMARLRT